MLRHRAACEEAARRKLQPEVAEELRWRLLAAFDPVERVVDRVQAREAEASARRQLSAEAQMTRYAKAVRDRSSLDIQ